MLLTTLLITLYHLDTQIAIVIKMVLHLEFGKYIYCHSCLVDWALERVKLLEILRISNDLRLAYGLRLAFRRM